MSEKNAIEFIYDGKPWYCAVDVCGALEYKKSRDAVRRHCDENVTVYHRVFTAGGEQMLLFISEQNLYRLACRCKLPKARKFEKRLFEVLEQSEMRAVGAVSPEAPLPRAEKPPQETMIPNTEVAKVLDANAILNRIKKREGFSGYGSESELARFFGVSSQTLSTWRKRNSVNIDMVLKKCPNYPVGWLLLGKLESLHRSLNNIHIASSENAQSMVEEFEALKEDVARFHACFDSERSRLTRRHAYIATRLEELKQLTLRPGWLCRLFGRGKREKEWK